MTEAQKAAVLKAFIALGYPGDAAFYQARLTAMNKLREAFPEAWEDK